VAKSETADPPGNGTGKPTRPWRRTEVRREEIISAAVKLWSERGYDATSVADLCTATGIGKGSMYHHISSKEEILFEIHNRFVDPMLVFGNEILESDGSVSEGLRAVSSELLAVIARYRAHCEIFFREMKALGPGHLKQVRAKRHEFENIVSTLIQRGIDSGEFRDEPVHDATMAFLGMHNYTYTWFRPRMDRTPAEVSEHFCTIFLEGLRR
jgi:TetR/AcrR family transcriptional regulator, cholesterol catabolism regulator